MIEKQKSTFPEERAIAGGEYGTQPLDALMTELGLSNTNVVDAAEDAVTHKMVNKARRGRRLSRSVQLKVLAALNGAVKRTNSTAEALCYGFKDLFTYDGR
ncbi:MAG: hypothetical protein ACI8T1_001876 [Verrucomicrobiales bacterium]|jgi:hypothetical protein